MKEHDVVVAVLIAVFLLFVFGITGSLVLSVVHP